MKIMAILSIGTSGVSSVSYRNLKNETGVILNCSDQLLQNLARLHILVHSFDTNHKNFKIFYFSHCFHRILSFFYRLSFVLTLMLFQRYKQFTERKI